MLLKTCRKLHGGAHLNAFRLIVVAAVMILASSVVRADGLDGRVNVNGGGPGSPPCGSTQFMANSMGQFNVDCTTTVITPVITFAALDAQTNGGLSCASSLTSIFGPQTGQLQQFNWTETTGSANGVDTCTFTAPAVPTGPLAGFLLGLLSNFGVINDGDCDINDFIFGIAKGCDIIVNTNVDGSLPFAPNAVLDLGVNGAPLLPLPEPTSLALLATGLATLVLGRRRSKNVRTEI